PPAVARRPTGQAGGFSGRPMAVDDEAPAIRAAADGGASATTSHPLFY
ncbi:hypothetical protein A2U01_0096606, partial [Trifolium medium]|nr:hypothetical protein [Trifolium medium]